MFLIVNRRKKEFKHLHPDTAGQVIVKIDENGTITADQSYIYTLFDETPERRAELGFAELEPLFKNPANRDRLQAPTK